MPIFSPIIYNLFTTAVVPVPKKGDSLLIPYCLYRVTNGKKKISTEIKQEELSNFHPLFMGIVRGSMTSLKKKEKKKKKSSSKDTTTTEQSESTK